MKQRDLTGEVGLWGAVLMRAHDDLALGRDIYHGEVAQQFDRGARARAWFRSNETHIGSFQWVCDVTGIDRDAVIDKIKEKL